jgi:hypothetical protein
LPIEQTLLNHFVPQGFCCHPTEEADMTKEKPEPIENRPGKQMDDNIDDLGRKPDGTTLDQPTNGPKIDSTRPSVRQRNSRANASRKRASAKGS